MKPKLTYLPISKAFILGRGYFHLLVIGHQYNSSGTIKNSPTDSPLFWGSTVHDYHIILICCEFVLEHHSAEQSVRFSVIIVYL
jgi:hypothetical protein